MLRPVLMENPTPREAQRLQRRIEDKLTPSSIAEVKLEPSSRQPISLELRDVSLRSLFEVLSQTYGINI
ncbi:MAG: type II secretion system protein GspD, partial [bacterium]